jgi:dihydroneopterin aldolase
MDRIIIYDLEVFYHVGVPDEEREKPQRLLLTLDMEHDLTLALAKDDVRKTIDYHLVTQKLLHFGEGKSWKLIERLAADIADMVLREFKPQSVTVEVKKFVLPQTRFVAARLKRSRNT